MNTSNAAAFSGLMPKAGTRVVVAGGCGGIGRAFVAAAHAHDMQVIVLDLDASIRENPPPQGVQAIGCNALHELEVKQAIDQVRSTWGACDAFINLVGYTRERTPVEHLPSAEWDDILSGTLRSAYLLSREAIPLLRAGQTPALVHTSSTFGVRVAMPGYAPYAAAKAGVINLVRALATELAPVIRVNAVAPGAVQTAFLKGGTSQPEKSQRIDVDQLAQAVPLQRIAQPDDIVGPLMFLIGPGSAYMTGQTVHVNGGFWS
ncbi:MAG: SDR family oxidoreductase [Burkholderiaceae bacterium]